MTQSISTFNFSWGSQQSYILNGLKTLAVGEVSNVFLTDVTLACEGHYIEAHRLVLSLCSSFFKDLFNQNEKISDKAHGIVILSHVSAVNLRYILQFMYQGSVQVPQEHVDGFLQTGSMLKVEGLTGATGVAVGLPNKIAAFATPSSSSAKPSLKLNQPSPSVTPMKRRRTSGPGGSIKGSDADHNEGHGHRHSTRSRAKFDMKKPSLLRGVTSTSLGDDEANDDSGDLLLNPEVILDDCRDGGGDSDFDGATDGVDVTGDKVEGVAAALNLPGPSTSIQKDQKTPKLEVESEVGGGHGRKNNDSSSSDEDDDDDDDSSESSDSIGDYVDLPPRRILRKLTYELSERFQNLDEAKAYVRGLQSWKINDYRTLANNNTKHNYICRFVKGCPARMYLLEHDTIDLYLSTTEHSHPPMVRKPFGMSEEVKAKINRLYRKGITGPVSLQKALKEAGLEEPTITQLTGYTRRIRDKIRAKISKRTRKANKGSCSVEMKLE